LLDIVRLQVSLLFETVRSVLLAAEIQQVTAAKRSNDSPERAAK